MLNALYRMHLRRTAARAQDEAGFTMVELVIGIFIFALVIGGVTVGMSSSLNLTRQNRNRSIAANLASQEMDTVRSTDFVDLPLGMITTTIPVDGVPYDVTRQTEWVTPSATSGACQAPSGSALAYLSVTVTVTWNNMAGVPAPTSHTVVTPPVGTYDTTRGHVAVMVRDAAGAPQEGVPVALAGPGVADSQTTSLGRLRVLRLRADRQLHGDAQQEQLRRLTRGRSRRCRPRRSCPGRPCRSSSSTTRRPP